MSVACRLQNPDGRVLEDVAVLLFRLLESLFSATPFGDVVDDRIQKLAAADIDGTGMHFDIADLAARSHVTEREETPLLRSGDAHLGAHAVGAEDVDVPDVHRLEIVE